MSTRKTGKHGGTGNRSSSPDGRSTRKKTARKKTTRKSTTRKKTKSTRSGGTSTKKSTSKRGGGKRAGERIHKYIANCGYCSRRRAEILVEKGLVKVNNEVAEPNWSVVAGRDEVTIHGERIVPPAPLTIMLNKPAGYITSTHDTHDRLTVMDLLPKKTLDTGVLPAGRLDLDTEGLLIFTNDGDLLHRITHPSFECEKEYKVLLNRAPTAREKDRLEKGVFLEELGKWTSDARIVKLRKRADGSATLHVYISEGMKRQVRRMFSSMDMKVLHLDRLSIAGVQLGELKRGEWRKLSEEEVRKLRSPDPTLRSRR